MDEILQLKTEIQSLREELSRYKALVDSMQNYNTMPPDFRKSIGLDVITTSAKLANSEAIVVDEGGATVHTNVQKQPDGYDQKTVGGVTHYYPYYT